MVSIGHLLQNCAATWWIVAAVGGNIREQEIKHIETALSTCEYPKWTIMKVMKQIKRKTTEKPPKREEKTKEEKSKGMVVLPYVQGLTGPLKRVFGKHQIATSIKPHMTKTHPSTF